MKEALDDKRKKNSLSLEGVMYTVCWRPKHADAVQTVMCKKVQIRQRGAQGREFKKLSHHMTKKKKQQRDIW